MKSYVLGFRLFLFNAFINKIPLNFLRHFFIKQYINVGSDSFIAMNVKLLNYSLKRKKQITIGNNCVINPDVLLDGRMGKIVIKNNVDIARGSWIFTAEHDPHDDYHNIKFGDVIIEDHVWIASRVTVLPGVTIGRGSVIAAGAIVTKDVPPMSIAGGIPAKVLGQRKSELKYNLRFNPKFYL
ncbi:MAG: acyltransferase [Arachidicoccus sp.]|nr:acyltransferase [Arachidicoccus sp.]